MITLNEWPNLNFHGLEILSYGHKNKLGVTDIKITDYFPKTFKFRSLNVLKHHVFLQKVEE